MNKTPIQFYRFKKLLATIENDKLNSAKRKPPERVLNSVSTEETTKGKKENEY